MKKTSIQRTIWLFLVLLLFLTAQARAETTILFTGNSFGEFNPCPS
jgi:hypothetical protein